MMHRLMVVLVATTLFVVGWAQDEKRVPDRPFNLQVRPDQEGATSIAKLSWQDESDNELGFEILRSRDGEKFEVVGFVGSNTTTYEDKVGRYVTGTYIYTVRAFNNDGKSEQSNQATVWF